MEDYGVRDVERLLRLSRGVIRSLIAAGFVSPRRGPRNSWRFSFQDLVVLRTAQALVEAKVPPRRITRALRELRVVGRGSGARWQAETGQYLLEFEGDPVKGKLSVIEREPVRNDAQAWIDHAAAVEAADPKAAIEAYERAIEQDPSRLDARINLGLLLHETRRYAKAESVYRAALEECGSDPLLLFNLGVLLEDLNQRPAAIEAYAAALRLDPALADAHYNLALLYRKAGRPREAIRHLSQYRKLS